MNYELTIERALRKVIAKYPACEEPVLTDIHLEVKPDSGELLAYDDDDNELTRCVVEEWIRAEEEGFYDKVSPVLCKAIDALRPEIELMSVLHPFSFVLVDSDHETICDIYLVDEDQQIISGDLLKGFEDELDKFFADLMKD